MEPGDKATFTDGLGNACVCELIDNHPKRCVFNILAKENLPHVRDYHLHLAVAPTKNISRFEWFLEKATEIGIDEITPIICDHSERVKVNIERLERVLIAAMKQSQQVWLPQLNEPVDFSDFVHDASAKHLNYIAWVSKAHQTLLKSHYQPGKDATILIGPEGDFSKNEIDLALSNDFIPISLGENRLRTETAAIVACHTVVLLNQ
jgi:16S rRNA (uracil1498-N3)-methyltransferase